MNPYLIFILAVLVIGWLFDTLVEMLNIKHMTPEVPGEFKDVYEQDEYRRSQEYERAKTRFGIVQSLVTTPLTIAFILLGGFAYVDQLARSVASGEILTGLVFAGILGGISQILAKPFHYYYTFVLEERFGFNKMTRMLFIKDTFKNLLLGIIVGSIVFSVIIGFFLLTGKIAWVLAWVAMIAIQLFIMYIYPVVVLPWFNEFEPLPDGELRDGIEAYAQKEGFKLTGIFTMDGSKRSTKSNAYFTGFGKNKRIVLFDTLVEQLTTEELVAVLAHEMGHFKLKHILKMMVAAFASTGLLFYLLSLFLKNEQLFAAFGIAPEHVSIYGSIIFFGILFAPISEIINVFLYILVRKNEYEADAYAVKTYQGAEPLIGALKKLTVKNLGNLTPHPLKVKLQYSHPPVLQRIEAMRAIPVE